LAYQEGSTLGVIAPTESLAKNISPRRKNEKWPESIPLSELMMTRQEVIALELGKMWN